MLDKWHKKEKPVFTGISRGLGGFGFGGAAAAEDPPVVEVLFASYSSSYTDSGGTDDSSTKVLASNIKYLYVLGTGGGGGGNFANGSDTGGGGGGGAASIRRLVGYSIPGASQGQPIQVKVGHGGRANNSGAATVIQINGSTVLSIGGGSNGTSPFRNGGAGGTVSSPGLTRLSPFPADFEATGGTGGSGAIRDSADSTVGNSGGPTYGTGGGGGGGAHLSPKDGRSGGTSTNPGGPYTYDFFQKNHAGSFPNPFPAVISPVPGGTQAADDGQGSSAPQRGENKGLATGGGGHGQDSNTGRSGGAGGGFQINTPNDPGPTSIHGGGGGGIRSQIGPPNSFPIMGGDGGSGFIIVVGSSYQLVSGTDY